MEIKTKFSFGDKVWTLKNCKAVCFEVRTISVSDSTLLPVITYQGYENQSLVYANESQCFESKEALLEYVTSE